MRKRYEIYYNDGAFYGEVTFTNKTRKFIKDFFIKEIKNNNKNTNKLYHIGFKNIKKMEVI